MLSKTDMFGFKPLVILDICNSLMRPESTSFKDMMSKDFKFSVLKTVQVGNAITIDGRNCKY